MFTLSMVEEALSSEWTLPWICTLIWQARVALVFFSRSGFTKEDRRYSLNA